MDADRRRDDREFGVEHFSSREGLPTPPPTGRRDDRHADGCSSRREWPSTDIDRRSCAGQGDQDGRSFEKRLLIGQRRSREGAAHCRGAAECRPSAPWRSPAALAEGRAADARLNEMVVATGNGPRWIDSTAASSAGVESCEARRARDHRPGLCRDRSPGGGAGMAGRGDRIGSPDCARIGGDRPEVGAAAVVADKWCSAVALVLLCVPVRNGLMWRPRCRARSPDFANSAARPPSRRDID